MNEKRVQELMAGMKACSKEAYYKSEVLDELLALQREMVSLTFNGDHAATADLKIYDVERHLKRLNRETGQRAGELLTQFMAESADFCNLIKSEISGRAGEARAFKALEEVQTRTVVLKNIELNDGGERTELDAAVITPFGIIITEVKNFARDMFIDANGDMYRTGEYLRMDCDLAAKTEQKEKLLGAVVKKAGYDPRAIHRVVVFTNNKIEVRNKCESLRTCFISQLPDIIDSYSRGDYLYGPEDMERLKNAIEAADSKERYPLGFDADAYKRDFAELMATLEEERMALTEISETQETKAPAPAIPAPAGISLVENEACASAQSRRHTVIKYIRRAGAVAALTAVSVLSGILAAKAARK